MADDLNNSWEYLLAISAHWKFINQPQILVCLGKSPSEALCMVQQVYKEQSLSRSTVFLRHKRFKPRHENVEDDPRCETITAPPLHKLYALPDHL